MKVGCRRLERAMLQGGFLVTCDGAPPTGMNGPKAEKPMQYEWPASSPKPQYALQRKNVPRWRKHKKRLG